MADTTATRRIDIVVGSSYSGAGVKSATADLAKLRADLNLPVMGPLTRPDQLVQNAAIQRIKAMENAATRAQTDETLNARLYGIAPGRSAESQARRDAQAALARGWRAKNADVETVERNREFQSIETRTELMTRLRGGLSARADAEARTARLAEAEANLKQTSLFQQERMFQRMAKGFVGGAIAGEVGRALQKLPEAEEQYYQNLKNGMTKTQAFATMLADNTGPIGELAKGFRAAFTTAWDFVSPEQAARKREKERLQADRDQADTERKRLETLRNPILESGRNLAESSANRIGLSGLLGGARQAEELRQERAQKDLDLAPLAAKITLLANDQQGPARMQIAAAKLANELEFNDKMLALQKQLDAATESDRRQHADRLKSIEDDTRQTVLETDGKFYAARLQAVKDAERQQQLEIIRIRHDESLDPDVDQTKANARYSAEMAASREREGAKTRRIVSEENRGIREDEFEHQQKMFDAHSTQSERVKRLMGDTLGADDEAIARRRSDVFASIDREQRQRLEAHPERKDLIDKQASESRASADFDSRLDRIQNQYELAEKFTAHPTVIAPMGDSRLLTGVGGQIKQEGHLSTIIDLLQKLVNESKDAPRLQMAN